MRTWYEIKADNGGIWPAQLFIYDEIGGFGVSVSDFAASLAAAGNAPIDLHINSNGGDVFVGNAIYNILKRRQGAITVYVDGVAASMASLIAMAGDKVIMPANALMMIHDPAAFHAGTANDMADMAALLTKMREGMIQGYAGKSKQDPARISEMMLAETWLTADDAVKLGFADSVEEPIRIAASSNLSRFKSAPRALLTEDDTTMTKQEIDALRTEITAEVTTAVTAAIKATLAEEMAAAEVVEAEDEGGEAPDEAAITAKAAKTAQENTKRIAALCDLAGFAGKAAGFIAEGKSQDEVIAALAKLRTDAGGTNGSEVSARNGNKDGAASAANNTGKDGKPIIDTGAVYAQWNRPRAARRA